MSTVVDSVGREFSFDAIRFKLDEALLQQASMEVVAQDRERPQMLFERYCSLHRAKYGRNFEPAHFASDKLLSRYREQYANPTPVIRVCIEVREGPLFERYVGQPPERVEESVRRDPGTWVRAGTAVRSPCPAPSVPGLWGSIPTASERCWA